MNLNQLLCPDCNDRMFVIYDESDKYASHGCKKCKFFHKLSNPEEFESNGI